jgi:hypothetical protein
MRNASQVSSSTATRATRAPGELTRRFGALRSSGSCGRLEAWRLRFRAISPNCSAPVYSTVVQVRARLCGYMLASSPRLLRTLAHQW